MGVCPTNHEPKATASRVTGCGEEAGVQKPDLTNRNHVERHDAPGKLARDSEALTDISGVM